MTARLYRVPRHITSVVKMLLHSNTLLRAELLVSPDEMLTLCTAAEPRPLDATSWGGGRKQQGGWEVRSNQPRQDLIQKLDGEATGGQGVRPATPQHARSLNRT